MTATASDAKDRLLTELEAQLGGRASKMLMERLRRTVADSGDSPDELEQAVHRIRTAVRLFVDESLAEELEQQLRRAAGLHE